MSNSSLIVHTHLSPNHSGRRNHVIDTITIHCVVGHCSLQTLGQIFADPNREASSNYGVDDQGFVGMYVEECNRSWCSSSASNDHRAITIEVASDTFHPYAVTNEALWGLIALCEDICRRNNIPKLLWEANPDLIGQVDKQNLTVHRWFAAKACPGDYLYGYLPYIVKSVNNRLAVPVIPIVDLPYQIRIIVPDTTYHQEPSFDSNTNGVVPVSGIYTIVEEVEKMMPIKWGRLKSGAGWICLNNVEKLPPR